MSDVSDRKAELDSKDIELPEYDKAKLDKEGIEDKAETRIDNNGKVDSNKEENNEGTGHVVKGDAVTDGKESDQEDRAHKRFSPKLLIIAGIGVMVLCLGSAWIFIHMGHINSTSEKPKKETLTQVITRTESTDGELVMDPFIVFFRTKTGATKLLIAQVSLGVDPDHKQDLVSREFDLRRKILNCLSSNVQVYKKKEIVDILKSELKVFGIRDLAFVRYSIM